MQGAPSFSFMIALQPKCITRLNQRAHRYKLQDYWETPYWPVKVLVNITQPPTVESRNMSLWQMGNIAILCK